MPKIDLALSTLRPDSLHPVEHGDTKLVVVRSNGNVHAFHDTCPHAFWPLSAGSYQNKVIECAGHGWEFDVETGRCLTTPVYCLKQVAVSVEGDTVRLEWPDT